MDFSEVAACGTDTAEVVRGGNVYTSIKCAPFIDCYVIIIIGKGEDFRCHILDKKEQAISKAFDKPLFYFHIASRLIQAFRQIGEICTDARTGIKQSHTKLLNRIQTLDRLY